ncbi:hypothetical protein AB0I98_27685 [Streptomyces sp. NPDC050211]|uniref:hypothetical protein n=1 Tax=Streptomyces sp. NPDC050211 TaxID=3154932 RepID=UPI003416D7E6
MGSTGASRRIGGLFRSRALDDKTPRRRRSFDDDIRRARKIFRSDLCLRPGATLQELVEAVAELNQRPIRVDERDLDPSLGGMCLHGPTEDRIIVGRDNTEWQQHRVKVHEIGHLLPGMTCGTDDCLVSGHGQVRGSELDPQTLANQLTTLSPDLVHDVLNASRPVKLRATHDNTEELAVEAWATVVPRLLAPPGDVKWAGQRGW